VRFSKFLAASEAVHGRPGVPLAVG
jgi:hypothetical protein